MKLDRFSWIVLFICAGVLGANFYFNKNKAEAQKQLIEQQAAVAKQAGTTSAAGTTSQSTQPAGAPAQSQAQQPMPQAPVAGLQNIPPAPAKEETYVLESAPAPTAKEIEQGKKPAPSVRFVFTNLGGGLKYAEFPDQHSVGDKTSFVQQNGYSVAPIGALAFNQGSSSDLAIDSTSYTLDKAKTDSTRVTYTGRASNGFAVSKEFSLVPADPKKSGTPYLLKCKLTVTNPDEQPKHFGDALLFAGSSVPLHSKEVSSYQIFFHRAKGKFETKKVDSFKGGIMSGGAKTADTEDLSGLEFVGVMNQFFATVITPTNAVDSKVWSAPFDYELPVLAGGGTHKGIKAALTLPGMTFNPKQEQSYEFEIFTGPKRNGMLRQLNSKLGDIMDYGWFGFVSRPLNWILNWLQKSVINWGLAIIGLVCVVRIVLWPLQNKSNRVMKRMSALQPKMDVIRKKYADNQQKMNTELMKLYRDYGVNPMGGCLPMLLQMPIFFGFYTMLQFAVELREKPFFGWVKDLSQPDTVHVFNLPFSLPFLGNHLPINILPFVMGITMILQMKMTPKAGDKTQQFLMKLMPVMFFMFCYNFASALALYWSTQNLLSIFQTWIMKKMPEPALEKKETKKKGFFQKLMEQQAAAQQQKSRK